MANIRLFVPYVNFLVLIISLWLCNLLRLGQLGEEYTSTLDHFCKFFASLKLFQNKNFKS